MEPREKDSSVCCPNTDGLIVVRMSSDVPEIRNLTEIATRGAPQWWLCAARCNTCGTVWLLASDERHNDVHILRRRSSAERDALAHSAIWPDDFDTYERILEIAMLAGCQARFFSIADSPILYTTKELASVRPGITVSRLAELFAISKDEAAGVANIAVAESGVEVSFN